jgi:hypothetical protein
VSAGAGAQNKSCSLIICPPGGEVPHVLEKKIAIKFSSVCIAFIDEE